jgi:hypothetical protein
MQPDDNGLLNDIEQLNGAPLDDADYDDVAQWQRGLELRGVVTTPAWEIILNSLQSYADKAAAALLQLPPGDERVMYAHAAASAAAQINTNFRLDVQSAIEAASQVPEVLKRGLRNDTTRSEG